MDRQAILEARANGHAELRTRGLLDGWVFPSRTGTFMQPSSLREPLARACAASKVNVISPHGLRYTFNHLAKRRAAGDVVRAITGHVTEETTAHYDWFAIEEKRAAVDSVFAAVAALEVTKSDLRGDHEAAIRRKSRFEHLLEPAAITSLILSG